MDLRCLVFSSDAAAAPLICQALSELGVEVDHCPDPAAAIARVASESFQIVIADWDEQPDAEYLLKSARARKPAERPLTLAIVGDDASVPKALQAGSNSVLRKPILVSQVKDTLETARSLLKAKHGSTVNAPLAAGQNSSPVPSTKLAGNETHLRAGEFLTSSRPTPGAQFDTESELQKEMVPSAGAIDQLKDLEPMAAAVSAEQPAPAPPIQTSAQPNQSRGLQWYLNRRTTSLPSAPTVPMPAPPPPETPQLMGYDQMAAGAELVPSTTEPPRAPQPDRAPRPDPVREQKAEAELFTYIAHGSGDSENISEQASRPHSRLGKAIIFALALAACAMVAAPQAPWHPAVRRISARGQRSFHTWLNPQIVEPTQAPEVHENFARAGDEYKLPVAENIPDATTDPTQIRVVPVVDPTAKKPGNNGTDQNSDGSVTPADSSLPADGQPAGTQVQANAPQPAAAAPSPIGSQPASNPPSTGAAAPSPLPAQPPISTPTTSSAPPPAFNSNAALQPVSTAATRPTQKSSPPVAIAAANTIPSSLKSQMASPVPEASGNKNPDTALPAIEPVAVPEAAERALITGQPTISYPADARGQQGTVILQLLIGRDGSVQDAKFLQGSLAFARAAIDGVRSWKFKPYLLNGRPVSVQTQLTLRFSPG
jgi:periplasmic protein TonB